MPSGDADAPCAGGGPVHEHRHEWIRDSSQRRRVNIARAPSRIFRRAVMRVAMCFREACPSGAQQMHACGAVSDGTGFRSPAAGASASGSIQVRRRDGHSGDDSSYGLGTSVRSLPSGPICRARHSVWFAQRMMFAGWYLACFESTSSESGIFGIAGCPGSISWYG